LIIIRVMESFWDNVRFLLIWALKIVALLVIIQLIFFATKVEANIPWIYVGLRYLLSYFGIEV